MIVDSFTRDELGLLGLALMKCHLLQETLGKKGKYKLCILTKEGLAKSAQQGNILMCLPFSFPDTTDEQLLGLMERLEQQEKIAFLRESKL